MNEPDNFRNSKAGLARWCAAFVNSYHGLLFAVKNEAAIREELIALMMSVPLSMVLVDSIFPRVVLILSVLLVLIVEVLNSALEAILDRVSPEYHDLAKAGKDLGSLAVLLTIVFSAVVWITILLG